MTSAGTFDARKKPDIHKSVTLVCFSKLGRMGPHEMKVRLTRKLAESIDGVDLSRKRVGRIINVGRHDAQLLIAEGWGAPADPIGERAADVRGEHGTGGSRASQVRHESNDRPTRRRAAKRRKST